jgi:hypothetical protein
MAMIVRSGGAWLRISKGVQTAEQPAFLLSAGSLKAYFIRRAIAVGNISRTPAAMPVGSMRSLAGSTHERKAVRSDLRRSNRGSVIRDSVGGSLFLPTLCKPGKTLEKAPPAGSHDSMSD